jgi:hypothetical protein
MRCLLAGRVRIARKANGIGGRSEPLDDTVKSHLFEALGSTLDSIVIGVIIVADQGRILHANQAAQCMFAARSPIVSLGGCLAALQGDLTKELRRAIAAAQVDASRIGGAGIGVPLVDKNMAAATAHVLPLACSDRHAHLPNAQTAAAVFVTPAISALPAEIGTVARVFSLTPAEARLLQHLVSGASLTEAADRTQRRRGHGANASQSHLHQDRRVPPNRSPGSRRPSRPPHSPLPLTSRPSPPPNPPQSNGLDRTI